MKLTHCSKECLHLMFSYLGLGEVVQLSIVCRLMKESLDDDFFWSIFLTNFIESKYSCVENGRNILVCLRTYMKSREFHNLETAIVSCSSIDRDVEAPTNVLKMSTCLGFLKSPRFSRLKEETLHIQLSTGYHVQRHCGCAGPSACYWSSHPTPNGNKVEYLTASLVTPLSIVCGISIAPYRAFFHPNAPTYGPREVCLQLLWEEKSEPRGDEARKEPRKYEIVPAETMDDLKGKVFYQSQFFSIENVFEVQHFYLPVPVLCPSARARLVLRGFSQRQSLHDEPLTTDDFYMCLSLAKIFGLPLFNHRAELVTRAASSSSGAIHQGKASSTTAAGDGQDTSEEEEEAPPQLTEMEVAVRWAPMEKKELIPLVNGLGLAKYPDYWSKRMEILTNPSSEIVVSLPKLKRKSDKRRVGGLLSDKTIKWTLTNLMWFSFVFWAVSSVIQLKWFRRE